MLIVALVGIVVGTVAGLLGYRKSQETYAFEPLNLADGIQPRSSHVELTGMAAPSMQVQYIEKTTGETRTTVFIPLLPPQWHQGVPIVYFLRPHSDYYVGPNGTFPLSEESRAFHIQQQGVLMRNDMPGVVTTAYEKRGIKLGTPPRGVRVLDERRPEPQVMVSPRSPSTSERFQCQSFVRSYCSV